jgi:type I restriction enzyme S subunit
MSRKFRCKAIPSTWLENEGRRLDCGPYLSGAMEAKQMLEQIPTQPLKELIPNGTEGIQISPYFKRIYIENDSNSILLLGNSDILMADHRLCADKLARKVYERHGNGLKLIEGAILITCFGTVVGKLAYCRADMADCAASTNFMRLNPNWDVIKPGYLFSFLSSKFGMPLITQGQTGSAVVNFQPSHVANMPIPRLGKIENITHDFVQAAADLRVEAAELLKKAGQMINKQFGFPEKLALSHRVFSCSVASSFLVIKRMEATFHDAVAQESDRLIACVPRKDEFSNLGVSIGETGRLKQVFVDEEYGVPFLTSGEIFRQRYEPTRFLSNRLLPDESEWATQEGDLLLARSGQVGGIIGRGVWADRRFAGGCVSVDVLRLNAQNSRILPGYLYAYLFLTDVGYRQLIRTAAGSSIPHLSAQDILRLLIPRCDCTLEAEINELVWNAGHKRAEAQEKEDKARSLVECAIEERGR